MRLSVRGRSAMVALGALYESALDDCDDPVVMDSLAALMRCEHAVLARQVAGRWQWTASSGVQAAAQPSMDQVTQEFFAQLGGHQRADTLARTSDVIDLKALACSDLYQQHLRPLNGGLSLMVHGRVEGEHIALALCRPLRESADFGNDDLQFTRALWPHVKRAHLLRSTLRQGAQRSSSAYAALDALDSALVALDAEGRVLHANRSAQALLQHCCELRLQGQRLVAVRPQDDAQLRHALRAALAADPLAPSVPPAVVRLAGASPGSTALVLQVQPVLGRCADQAPEGAAVWVAVKDVRRVRTEPAQLRALFGLTHRESEVVARLCAGRVLAEVAQDLGIAEDSVRQHLKAVFSKTHTRNQTELVSLLLRSLG